MLSAVASAIRRMRIASASAEASASIRTRSASALRLGDLRRVELRRALKPERLLPLRLGLRDERGVRGLRLLQLALLVGDRSLGVELRFFGAPRLLRGHDVGVGLRLGGRLAAPRFGDFRLHDLDVQRVEDQPQVGELARARLPDDHGERIVLVLERLESPAASPSARCCTRAGSVPPAAASSERARGRRRLGREELVVGEQVDGAAAGARQQIGQRVHLIGLGLGEEPVGGRLDHRVGVAHRDDGAREHAHLDRPRVPFSSMSAV